MRNWKPKLTATLMAMGLALAGSAALAAPVTLKLATLAPQKSIWGQFFTEYVNKVDELSGGEVKIDVFWGGQLGNVSDTMSQMLRGRVDIWSGPVPQMLTINDAFTALALPGQFENSTQAACVVQKTLPQARALFASKAQLIAMNPVGFQGLLATSPISNPANLTGKKVRVAPSPVSLELYKATEANIVPINPSELMSAWATGMIDAADFTVVYAVATGMTKMAKYFVASDNYYNASGLMIGNKTWTKLSKKQQQAVMDAAEQTLNYEAQSKRFDAFEQQLAKVLEGKFQGQYIVPTGTEKKAWHMLGRSTWPQIMKSVKGDIKGFQSVLQAAKSGC